LNDDGVERWNDDGNVHYLERGPDKRPFDSKLSGPLGEISKRPFDKIGGYSSLGGLHKRVFDRIGGASPLGGLSKKSSPKDGESKLPSSDRLDERAHRAFDRIGGMSSFGGIHKKTAS